jgi:hypothetical protein
MYGLLVLYLRVNQIITDNIAQWKRVEPITCEERLPNAQQRVSLLLK